MFVTTSCHFNASDCKRNMTFLLNAVISWHLCRCVKLDAEFLAYSCSAVYCENNRVCSCVAIINLPDRRCYKDLNKAAWWKKTLRLTLWHIVANEKMKSLHGLFSSVKKMAQI